MFLIAHGVKQASGDADYNRRPNGGAQGMPSAHTSTAVLGASRLARDCVSGNPIVQTVTLLSAGFVGTSRVDAGAHDIWQVLAGAILGLICDRAFGKTNAARIWLVNRFRRKTGERHGAAQSPEGLATGKASGGRIGQWVSQFLRAVTAKPV